MSRRTVTWTQIDRDGRDIRALVAEGKVVAASGAEPTDWYSPPPGFIASPAIEPTHFALIPHGLRVELDRLHCIAVRELARRTGPDTLDAADRIIAVLDRLDGDPDLEDAADAEPSLTAPENVTGSQVVYMRGNDQDREAEAPETALPEIELQPAAEILP